MRTGDLANGSVSTTHLGQQDDSSRLARRNPAGQDRPIRVLVLSQFYPPEPAQLPRDIAESLRNEGFDVRVVTGFPNWPDGQVYSGYRQSFSATETVEGIQVHRVPLYVDYSTNPIKRIVNYCSFGVSALFASQLARFADVVYVYSTPMTAAIPAQLWRRLFGTPFVVHVQDLWPESVTGSGFVQSSRLNKAMALVLDPWLRSIYRASSRVVGISPAMVRELVRRGAPADRTSAVFNWADEGQVTLKQFSDSPGRPVGFLYAGNLGVMQDLENVVDGFKRAENIPGFDGRLVFAGSGTQQPRLERMAECSSKVSLIGRVPREEVNALNDGADFQLVTLKDLGIFRLNVPSKLQAALAAGMPVVTTVQGQVADLITAYDVGFVALPENPESIAEAFLAASRTTADDRLRMGTNARRLYEDLMSKSNGTQAVQRLLVEAAQTAKRLLPRTANA